MRADGRGRKLNPLRFDEVPVRFREAFAFDRQEEAWVGKARPRRQLSIPRTCSGCGEERMVSVTQLRQVLRSPSFTNLCGACSVNSRKGSRSTNWKGGRNVSNRGYILVYAPDHPHAIKNGAYVYEHRLVMEKELGRFLSPAERVRHRNGKKDDNRLVNLMLLNSEEENN